MIIIIRNGYLVNKNLIRLRSLSIIHDYAIIYKYIKIIILLT